MESRDFQQFEAALRFYRATQLHKITRSPGRYVYSQLLQRFCERLNTAVRLRAKTFWDEEMTVVVPEMVSNAIFRYGFFEVGLTRMVLESLRPGMVFFDIGAHFGYFTMLASHIVGESRQVHSFEPTGSTFEVLHTNVRNKKNVHASNLAAWSRGERLSFNDYGLKYAAFNSLYGPRLGKNESSRLNPQKYEVEAVSLDEYIDSTGAVPNLIKIDAESAEFEIIRGMERTITELRPHIAIEVGDVDVEGAVTSRTLLQHILNKGYRAFEFDGKRIVEHQLKDRYGVGNILLVGMRA